MTLRIFQYILWKGFDVILKLLSPPEFFFKNWFEPYFFFIGPVLIERLTLISQNGTMVKGQCQTKDLHTNFLSFLWSNAEKIFDLFYLNKNILNIKRNEVEKPKIV